MLNQAAKASLVLMARDEDFARDRQRMPMMPLCVNIFLPWFLFSTLFSVMSFRIHYDSPALANALVAAGYGFVALLGLLGWRAKRHGLESSWYFFSTIACLLAVTVAVGAGYIMFRFYTDPLYSIQTLNTYPSLDPSRTKGGQVMDAGRVYFTKDTGLDRRRAMGFMSNGDLFCVVPIVSGRGEMDSYDFWAVGKNCCSGVAADFRCGDYNNPHAHAGMRMVEDGNRAFYRLAVQQAEAAYGVKSTHPLFFHWTQDPLEKLESYRDKSLSFFLMGVLGYFMFNLICVGFATHAFATGMM